MNASELATPRTPVDAAGDGPSEASVRSWNPAKVRRWHGPHPHRGHRLLLAACLDDAPEEAAASWRRWLDWCDFEHEDSSSYELAALAVARLGAAAGDGSRVARCRGWMRRARVLSGLGLDAVRRAVAPVRDAGHELVATGDLAELPETALPIRTVEMLAVGVPEAILRAAREAAVAGPAGGVIESGRLPFAIGPGAAWHGRWFERRPDGSTRGLVPTRRADGNVACPVPTPEECLAMLLARGWRWTPPGGIRWIVSAHRLLTTAELDPPEVAAAAARDGSIDLLRGAIASLAMLPGFTGPVVAPRVAAIDRSLRGVPVSWRNRWRAARATRSPTWWPARLIRGIRSGLGLSGR